MTTEPEELSKGLFPDWPAIIQEARELVESVLGRTLEVDLTVGGVAVIGSVRLVENNN